MPTLQILLQTASGLYRDVRSGERYLGPELLERLSPDVLTSSVDITKVRRGVYAVQLKNEENRAYELFSRRQTHRPAQQ